MLGTQYAMLFITGVALMVGSAAQNAEPEFKAFADNLHDCQRFYEKSYQYSDRAGTATSLGSAMCYYSGAATTGKSGGGTVTFRAIKRTSSYTYTLYSPISGAANAAGDMSANADTTNCGTMGTSDGSFVWYAMQNNAAQSAYRVQVHWVADADF
jgi:hypothetical protein